MKGKPSAGDVALEFVGQLIVFLIYWAIFRFAFDAPGWAALVGATIMQGVGVIPRRVKR